MFHFFNPTPPLRIATNSHSKLRTVQQNFNRYTQTVIHVIHNGFGTDLSDGQLLALRQLARRSGLPRLSEALALIEAVWLVSSRLSSAA
eukprot:764472-Hanusia_phi.AAC.4